MKPIRCLVLAFAMLAATWACAATKMDEGFATRLAVDGTSLMPRNTVTGAQAGDEVFFWVQWKEPIPRSKLRCVIKGPGTDFDETDFFAEEMEEGFSVCGMETEDSDAGTFHFTQYLDGEMVAEGSIVIEGASFFGQMSLRKKWKWLMTVLGAIVFVGYWVRRTATGDKRSLGEVLGGESAPAKAVRESIAIGSRVSAGAVPEPAPKEDDGAQALRKLGQQYETAMAQPDKSKGLDLGRRYIGMLVADRNASAAVKVFRECLAADAAFRVAQAEEVLPVAKAARAAGDPKAAVAALRGFDKAYPGHGLIPDVYVFSARLMAEDLSNADMARKILQHVLDRYPGHYVAPEAKRYLQSMAPSA